MVAKVNTTGPRQVEVTWAGESTGDAGERVGRCDGGR
jgi:hypothetical protein